ncbi:transcriptional adapter 2-beta [Corythoichthys intestinalis]|uniref:transcriptional adapter 2-beta n=1 Tax=Corythoichthys intestinalis TaxID=161448 RepID=UPI0025A54A57|nr:transcriptional adapter 2-beta [Corythoichthys intestinalis]XP_061810534.1 transcriptional adapter 2-beta-like [Nerophis lumbriciformis]
MRANSSSNNKDRESANMADLGKKYCVNCLADVTNLRLRCTDCPDIELCPECFSAGAEIGNHRRWHGYQQVDGGRFSLWGPEAEGGWTSREEQSLLDAIEQFGFGNWEDMAAHVGAGRTPQEVMDHYVTMYIHGNLGKACISDSIPNRVTDHTCPGGGALSPSLTVPLPPLDISSAEQQQLGYMPLRDDYEIEFDQDAEKLISGLSVNYDDEDVEIEMKRAHVDMYVRKLRERQRRKNIARDYGLVPVFLGRDKKETRDKLPGSTNVPGAVATVATSCPPVPTTPKRKINKEEKEQRVRLRGLCQFMAHREVEELFENMHKERALRAKVRELQRCRRNGIARLDEAAEYEAARHKREKRKENKSVALSKRGGALNSGTTPAGPVKEESKEGEFAAIENLTGFELLSDREKLLCSSLNLSPARYLTVKTIIIKDHLQKRQGVPSKSRLPSYLDKVLRKRIVGFLTESGWISRDAV